MKCPCCGAAELVHDTRDETYTFNDKTIVIPAVTADFCPACGESITDASETDRVMREMRDRDHDDAMVEAFRNDPDYAIQLFDSIIEDGDMAELRILLRQFRKAFWPARRSLSGELAKFATFSPGFMAEGRSDQEQSERDVP